VRPRAATALTGTADIDLSDVPGDLRRAVGAALHAAGVDDGHLGVEIVGKGRMRTLNYAARGVDEATDVLAFPIDELRPGLVNEDPEEGVLGDLVLCPAVAEKQGATAGHGTEAEIDLLTVHGILHLLGYDHAADEEHREMFGLQDQLLAAWRAEQ
jgi:probable rRNA maturation factor